MKKKTKTTKKVSPKNKPAMEWQVGEYERFAEYEFCLPYQFLLLCKLTDVAPERILNAFMDNLGCGTWEREGRDKAKGHLIDYFLEMGYGQQYYTTEDLKQMFREMDAIGMLWPKEGSMDLVELQAKWRAEYYKYWFKKWWGKVRRKEEG